MMKKQIIGQYIRRSLWFSVLCIGISLSACQKPSPKSVQSSNESQDSLVGCYTVSHDEPAQIKISKNGNEYVMQMREFNDPNKNWDNPAPMQTLDKAEIQQYFNVEVDYVENVIARPDRMFVLAHLYDSYVSLNPHLDSNYLGFIYKGSNTIYKVACETKKVV